MLQIEAEGYAPHVAVAPETEKLTPGGRKSRNGGWEGDQQFHVELQPNPGWSGYVFRPDGSPAAGAQVVLGGQGFYARMEHQFGKISQLSPGTEPYLALADADGKFHFKPVLRAERIIIADESGWANVPIPSSEPVTITLQRWGRIEGTLRVGREPGAGQSLGLDPGDWDAATGLKTFPFIYETKTDDHGRFVFTHVPAGKHRLVRRLNNPQGTGALGMSHTTWVDVRPGETSHATVGGQGAIISGRLVPTTKNPLADWAATVQRLERTDAASDTRQASNRYEFFCKQDGSFIVYDIPAGMYTLKLRVLSKPEKPSQQREWMPGIGPELGVAEREVVVPDDSDSLVNLGDITVKVKE